MRFAEFEIRSLPMQVSGQSGPGELSLRWQWNGYMVAFCCSLLAFGLADTRHVYIIYILYIGDGDGERDIQYIYNLFKCFLGHPMLETHQTYPKIWSIYFQHSWSMRECPCREKERAVQRSWWLARPKPPKPSWSQPPDEKNPGDPRWLIVLLPRNRDIFTGWWFQTFFIFPYIGYWEESSQLTFIFFRGVGIPPISLVFWYAMIGYVGLLLHQVSIVVWSDSTGVKAVSQWKFNGWVFHIHGVPRKHPSFPMGFSL